MIKLGNSFVTFFQQFAYSANTVWLDKRYFHYCLMWALWAAGCISQLTSHFLGQHSSFEFLQSIHDVSKVSVHASAMWNTMQEASRPLAILKS